jgi:hypothetical protein
VIPGWHVLFSALTSRQGIALPMALVALLILAALALAFSVLAATEPTIASNQLLVAQARALAESGVEHAVWALSAGRAAPGAPGTLASPLARPVPAPFDGSVLVPVATGGVSIGGFRLHVAPGPAVNERAVTSIGWAPIDALADPRTKAHQRVVATLMDFGFPILDLSCALCARGDIRLSGGVTVDARSDTSCGSRHGALSTRVAEPPTEGVIDPGDGHVFGADGNDVPDEAGDAARGQSQELFDSHALTLDNLSVLRAYAKSRGTYHQGAVTFGVLNRLADGVVFVDTASEGIDAASPASVTVEGRAGSGPGGVFRGWLIVNGGLRLSGDFEAQALLYAVNDIQVTGPARILGQVVSGNLRDPVTAIGGGAQIAYGCRAARTGGGTVPEGFVVKPGTYREIPDV